MSLAGRWFLECGCITGIALSGVLAHGQAVGPVPSSNAQTLALNGGQNQASLSVPKTSSISGTVLDTNGDVIQGARVQVAQAGMAGAVQQMN